jgi:hypothetical protein
VTYPKPSKLSKKEKYLRFIENTLFFKGGRWIANFDVAIRNFNISRTLPDERFDGSTGDIDALIYGGVKGKGFVLSRAFAFLASPTYVVSCAVIDLKNASSTRWSYIVSCIRNVRTLMEIKEFEWSWVVFFGNGKLPEKVLGHFERFNEREIGLVYADLKNDKVFQSNGFIARRGAVLFNPLNIDKKGFRLKFWKKD